MNEITKSSQVHNQILRMIEDNSNLQPNTKKQYSRAITNALAKNINLLDAQSISDYSLTLSKSSKGFLKAAIKLWAEDLTLKLKSQPGGDFTKKQDAIWMLEAIQKAIKTKKQEGTRQHTWLSEDEVKKMLDFCDTSSLIGQRDKIVLLLLFHAGLRREELTTIKFSDLIECPVGDKVRWCLNVLGKGAKDRALPLHPDLIPILEDWHKVVGDGYIIRSISKGEQIGNDISPIGIFEIVEKYGERIGKTGDNSLKPHDCRRTFAELGYRGGIDLAQVSTLLGHSSIETTKRYLNLKLDLSKTISDLMPI